MDREIEEKYTKECDEKILAFVRNRILPMYVGSEIKDRGEDWSPRYMVTAPLEGNEEFVDEWGLYDWCSEKDLEIIEDFNKLVEECEKICDEHNVFWCCPIHDAITFYDQEE